MHLVDTTMFFAPHSGGVKRYLLTKHAWLQQNTRVRHTLVVPGARTTRQPGGLMTVAAPPLPFSRGYRFPLRTGPWRDELISLAPDLIEAGDPYRTPWAALAAAERLAVPAVAFHHSDLTRLLTAYAGNWLAPQVNRYQRALYRRFELVLTPSRVMADRLAELGVARVEVQPLGVDVELFHPHRRDPGLRRRLGLSEDIRLLVFAGRISREKNLEALIGALRRLGPRYHLLVIGGEQERALAANVTLYPYQSPQGELPRLLASADALIHAGDQETFGLVILEAMASGLPVIGVRAGAIPELVDGEVGVLADRAQPGALADAITDLYDRDLTRLGRQARARAVAHYSWDRVLRGLIGRYARLLGRPLPMLEEAERAATG